MNSAALKQDNRRQFDKRQNIKPVLSRPENLRLSGLKARPIEYKNNYQASSLNHYNAPIVPNVKHESLKHADNYQRLQMAREADKGRQKKENATKGTPLSNSRLNKLPVNNGVNEDTHSNFSNPSDGLNKPLDHRQRLHAARSSSRRGLAKMANTTKKIAKAGTVRGAISIMKKIDMLGDWPFFAAIFAAIFKDIIDFVLSAYIPGLGAILSICAGIFIGLMMFLGGASEKNNMVKSFMKRGLVLFGGTVIEIVPGIDVLPVETITAAIIYVLVLIDREIDSDKD